jgi:4-amino-4-deoxy-L-arabinose transferase-like glycosyltransferase
LHDAARLAAAALLALTLFLLAATATELYGRKYRWIAVLLYVGSVGLWERAHQLSPELGLMLGFAAALYGFALARRPLPAARCWASGPASDSCRLDSSRSSGRQ